MEQITPIQAAATQPTLRTLLGLNAGQAVQGDAFAMIFQQMVNQDNGFGAIVSQMMENTQEDANKLGAQMAAEMLYMMPNPQLQMMLSLAQPQSMVQGVLDPQTQLQSAVQDALNSQTMDSGLSVEKLLSAFAGQKEDTAPTTEGLAFETFYTVLQNAWKEEQQPILGFSFQDGTLRVAKDLLAQKQKDTEQPLDIDSLQADVNAGRFLSLDAIAQKQAEPLPDITDVAAQLKTGILDNVAQGKNEFVVRLKPEGIGEIVVKLSNDKEKISLNIFTSSAQTAKMITDEVTALQNALRPLHAEVQQIVVTPSGHVSDYAAQTAMTNQEHQFQGQQFYGQGDQQSRSSRPQENSEFSSTVEQILEDDGLDTYI